MTEPKHIVVRGPNWAGDVIMATPGFRALRAGLPNAHIVLLLRRGLEALLDGSPWFDEILPLESYHRGPMALLREGVALRARRFDLGLCLPDSFSAALLLRIAGVSRIVGYRRGGRGLLLHEAVELPGPVRGGRVMVAREAHVLGLVERLGCPARGTHTELFVVPAERSAADTALADAGVDPGRPLALLAPGASYGPSKLWPAERFAQVGDRLEEEGAAVAITGTRAEHSLADRVAMAMTRPVANLAGRLSLGAFKSVVQRARLLVGNDAGARHIAVAFQVPSVILMGPTSLEKTNLNLELVHVLTANVSCRPCYQRHCPIDHRCMTQISPERVAALALTLLASEPSGLRTAGGHA